MFIIYYFIISSSSISIIIIICPREHKFRRPRAYIYSYLFIIIFYQPPVFGPLEIV